MAYKRLTDQKTCTGNPKCDLFCKIILGDVSDNIKPIFKSCGLKTALKCFEDNEFFLKKLEAENAQARFEMNTKLIDFNQIPPPLVDEFFQNNHCHYF